VVKVVDVPVDLPAGVTSVYATIGLVEIDQIRPFDMHICMDWRGVRFDWNRAKAFLVTAEEGSLSAAARALGMAQPTVGRQVDALEEELGVILFERVGRGLTLTPSGVELLEQVRAMGEAANRVSLTAAGQAQTIEGKISIAASETYSAVLLPPIIARLRALEPGIRVEIVTSNQASDLRRREADIAIRNFPPTEPDLIARKIRDVPARLYATPGYLASIGNPKLPAELSRAHFINIDPTGGYMKALNGMGLNLTERNFPLVSENMLVMWELVKAGLGIGVLDGNIGDAEPLLTRVLPDFDPIVFPIWLVAHRELNTSRRVRVVFDLLAAELAKA
jgi:DNA-binding transcriptional LysR family regulator